MNMKLKAPIFLALLALMLFACSSPAPEAPAAVEPAAAEVKAVEEEATMAEEEMAAEEMAEEEMEEAHSESDSDDHNEDAMDEDSMAEGDMEEDMEMVEGEEEMAEEEMMDEDAEMAESESMEAVYAVNVTDSVVTWKGSKAVGDFHTGTVDITEGSLTVADGALVAGSFVLDMNSLVSTDGANARLVGHLKADDFFGVDSFPIASLVINSAELIDGDQYAVQADLIIKEITNPIEFVATATQTDGQVSASADIVFDRAQFDVQYGSGSFFSGLGNDLINDEVEISVELVATK